MFDNIRRLNKLADRAKKLADILEKIEKSDANNNGILDMQELKPLFARAFAQSAQLKATLDEIGAILGANGKQVLEELGIDLLALAEEDDEEQIA